MSAPPELATGNFDAPDEVRPFTARGRVDVVRIGDMTVGRGVLEPGWRWSEHVQPLVGSRSCEALHRGYLVSGRMKVVMDDGSEGEASAGDVFFIPPGHDAWVVGDEPCVFVDFSGMENYASTVS